MEDDVPYFGAPPEDYEYSAPHTQTYRPPEPPRKRGGGIIKGIVLTVLVIFLVFLLLSPQFQDLINNNVPGYGRVLPKEAEFTVERRITLSGTGDYTLDLPRVISRKNVQDVVDMKMNPYPTDSKMKYGYEWDIWEGSLGTFDREDIITIQMRIKTSTLVWKMDSSGTVDDIPQSIKNQYTGDEWSVKEDDTALGTSDRDGDGIPDIMINPSAPQIRNLAHQIADDKPDVYSKAKAIFDYMVENFTYSTSEQMNYVQQVYGGLPKHALATLRDKWGDCDEQSMLYISFLRALGIPARMEMGALYDSTKNEWGGHAWVQVYIPSTDGQGYWYNVDVVNDEFLIRDADRFTTWVDDGNGDHLDDYYHTVLYSGNIQVSDEFAAINYTSSGEIVVSSDNSVHENPIPGFTSALFIFAAPTALFIWKRKRR